MIYNSLKLVKTNAQVKATVYTTYSNQHKKLIRPAA